MSPRTKRRRASADAAYSPMLVIWTRSSATPTHASGCAGTTGHPTAPSSFCDNAKARRLEADSFPTIKRGAPLRSPVTPRPHQTSHRPVRLEHDTTAQEQVGRERGASRKGLDLLPDDPSVGARAPGRPNRIAGKARPGQRQRFGADDRTRELSRPQSYPQSSHCFPFAGAVRLGSAARILHPQCGTALDLEFEKVRRC
jgi:hypothetical protein